MPVSLNDLRLEKEKMKQEFFRQFTSHIQQKSEKQEIEDFCRTFFFKELTSLNRTDQGDLTQLYKIWSLFVHPDKLDSDIAEEYKSIPSKALNDIKYLYEHIGIKKYNNFLYFSNGPWLWQGNHYLNSLNKNAEQYDLEHGFNLSFILNLPIELVIWGLDLVYGITYLAYSMLTALNYYLMLNCFLPKNEHPLLEFENIIKLYNATYAQYLKTIYSDLDADTSDDELLHDFFPKQLFQLFMMDKMQQNMYQQILPPFFIVLSSFLASKGRADLLDGCAHLACKDLITKLRDEGILSEQDIEQINALNVIQAIISIHQMVSGFSDLFYLRQIITETYDNLSFQDNVFAYLVLAPSLFISFAFQALIDVVAFIRDQARELIIYVLMSFEYAVLTSLNAPFYCYDFIHEHKQADDGVRQQLGM